MEIKFNVVEDYQSIERSDYNRPVANSFNYLTASFNIIGTQGCIYTPIFYNINKKAYIPTFEQTNVEDTQNEIIVTCVVPNEVIKQNGFYVSMFGYNTVDKTRISFPQLFVSTYKDGYTDYTNNEEIDTSKTKYEQILEIVQKINNKSDESAKINELRDAVEDMKQALENEINARNDSDVELGNNMINKVDDVLNLIDNIVNTDNNESVSE